MLTAVCRTVDKLTRGNIKDSEFESDVINHLERLEKKVSSLRDELPESAEKKSIMDEFEKIAMTELPKTLTLVCAYYAKSGLEEVLE